MPTLHWLGKDKVVNHAAEVPFHVLNHKYNFGGTSQNKIIHGDNLLALKSLLPLYENKIKCIYIDPPYNTGNENWVYNDNVNSPQIQKWLGQIVGKEGEDYTRHDKWLCMMYPRLKLLKQLLSDDGAIFISIDDNEVANLKLICNEIFGSQNFVGTISNTNNPKGRSFDKYIATAHEYILIYAKQIGNLTWNGFKPEEKVTRRYNKVDENGCLYREIDLRKTGDHDLREDRPNLFYYFYYNETTGDFFPDNEDKFLMGYVQIKPVRADGKDGCWRWGLETAKENLSLIIPKFMPTRKIWGVMQKDYLENKQYVKPTSSWTFKDVNSERGTEIFLKLGFSKSDFPKPKPIGTVERILQLATDKNSIILDAFAGSGTTAHAVINLNKSDGGQRKFILIEMEDYAESVTAERVRRIGGNFDFYELGGQIFIDDELNADLDIEKIREYIWQVDTHTEYVKPAEDCPEFMGVHKNVAYYFAETLDYEFLSTMRTRADNYVIYAETCAVDKEFLYKYKIEFRKVPRDILRYEVADNF